MLPQLHHQDLTKNKEAKVLIEVIFKYFLFRYQKENFVKSYGNLILQFGALLPKWIFFFEFWLIVYCNTLIKLKTETLNGHFMF